MEDLSIPGPKDKSPRVLRITYEQRVPRALQRNIQWPHVLEAINRITGAVQSAVSAAFPWLTRPGLGTNGCTHGAIWAKPWPCPRLTTTHRPTLPPADRAGIACTGRSSS